MGNSQGCPRIRVSADDLHHSPVKRKSKSDLICSLQIQVRLMDHPQIRNIQKTRQRKHVVVAFFNFYVFWHGKCICIQKRDKITLALSRFWNITDPQVIRESDLIWSGFVGANHIKTRIRSLQLQVIHGSTRGQLCSKWPVAWLCWSCLNMKQGLAISWVSSELVLC